MTDDIPQSREDWLADVQARYETKTEEILEELRREGIEPAMKDDRSDWANAGTPAFSCSFKDVGDGNIQVTASTAHRVERDRRGIIGGYWPRPPLTIAADDFLEALIRFWPSIAAPYLEEGAHWPETMSLDLPGSEPIVVERVDGWLEFPHPGSDRISLGSESVMAVETFRTIGDELVNRSLVSTGTAARWKALSDATDLPVSTVAMFEDEQTDPFTEATRLRETEWYAGKFGFDVPTWRLSAALTSARHALYNAGKLPEEPSSEEWKPEWRIDIPAYHALALVVQVAAAEETTVDDYLDQAGHDRNMHARGKTIFERERDRRASLPGMSP